MGKVPEMDQDEAHVDLTEAELNLLLVVGGGTPHVRDQSSGSKKI